MTTDKTPAHTERYEWLGNANEWKSCTHEEAIKLSNAKYEVREIRPFAHCTCPSGDGSLRHPCPAHPATLATVKHGGCVQLGGYPVTGEMVNAARCAFGTQPVNERGDERMRNALQAALSAQPSPDDRHLSAAKGVLLALGYKWNGFRWENAQPSPGGQDALGCIGRIEEAIEFRVPHDVYAAVHGELVELKAALAARQPVRIYGCCAQPQGELHTAECPNMRHLAARQPVRPSTVSDDMMDVVDRLGSEHADVDPRAWDHLLIYAPKDKIAARQPGAQVPAAFIEHFADQLSRIEMTTRGLGLGVGKHAVYAAPPAQAVDLGKIIEQIAQQWDGCNYDAVGETIDVGQAIRAAGKRLIDSRDSRHG